MKPKQRMNQHLPSARRTDTRQAAARQTTQAPRLFAVRKHDCDRLTVPPRPHLCCFRLHPGSVRDDRVCGCAAPQAPTCGARGAWHPQRARVARLGLPLIAPEDLLTSPTPPTLFPSTPLQEIASGTARGLTLWQPLAWLLGPKGTLRRGPQGVCFPGAIPAHALRDPHGPVDAGHRATVDQPLGPATAGQRRRTGQPPSPGRTRRRAGSTGPPPLGWCGWGTRDATRGLCPTPALRPGPPG
jgi:hypothetical protein